MLRWAANDIIACDTFTQVKNLVPQFSHLLKIILHVHISTMGNFISLTQTIVLLLRIQEYVLLLRLHISVFF